jgi:membrane protease YdiL (CAAX protease family)
MAFPSKKGSVPMSALFNRLTAKSPASAVDVVVILVIYFLGYTFLFPALILLIGEVIPGFTEWPYTDVIYHGIMTLVFLFLGRRYLQEKGKVWNLKTLLIVFQGFLAMLFGAALLNILISTLTGLDTSINQQTLIDYFLENSLAVTVQAVIFAPIAEEVVFRGVLFRQLRVNNRVIIPLLVSSMVFAAMHALGAVLMGAWSDLWFIPMYAYMGLVLAVVYERTQNLYAAIAVHLLNNAVSIMAMYSLIN